MAKKIAILGNTTAAAILASDLLCNSDCEISWFTGRESRFLLPVGILDSSFEHEWKTLNSRIASVPNLKTWDWESGFFLRDWRNKVFQPPKWKKDPAAKETILEFDRMLLDVENESSVGFPLLEWEMHLRKWVEEKLGKRYNEDALLHGFDSGRLVLSSGDTKEFDHIFWLGRTKTLGGFSTLPEKWQLLQKNIRSLGSMGALQVIFEHHYEPASKPNTSYVPRVRFFSPPETFSVVATKDRGEETDRRIVGYFFENACNSIWTFLLNAEEAEDHQTIGRKIKRLKHSLQKAFESSSPFAGQTQVDGNFDFSKSIVSEFVALHIDALCRKLPGPFPEVIGVSGFEPSLGSSEFVRAWLSKVPTFDFLGRIPSVNTETRLAPESFSS